LLTVLLSITQIMGAETRITILFTGDRHGHVEPWVGWEEPLRGKTVGGMDRLKTAADQIRAQVGKDNVLLLDSGDAIGDTFIAAKTKGKAVIELMNLAGYDAMTIGNHEPDSGVQELRQRIHEARFPVVAANLFDTEGNSFTKPYVLRTVGGLKVGILGLAYENTPLTTAKKNIEGLQFRDAIGSAREMIPRMKAEGEDLIIGLAHGGLGAEKKWAKALQEVDVIIGGHSHNRTDRGMTEGKTIIAQAGAHGADLGRLDLEVQNGKITGHRSQLILLDNSQIPADSATAQHMEQLLKPYRDEQNRVIARATKPIIRAQTMAGEEPRKRSHESPADSLFADILRELTGSDAAFLPGVGYGVAIAEGDITTGMLKNLVPHDSKVVTMKLTGAQIRSIVEQALVNTFTDDPKKKVGGMIQISGVSFVFQKDASDSARLLQLDIGGKPVENSRTYKVATNSMLAEGGHNYAGFRQGTERHEHGNQFDLIESWMTKARQVQRPAPGRIQER
jgi:2',3'-cyclic-nucleotide 2'-phosphodiesterase (5'-nucleotidase family)